MLKIRKIIFQPSLPQYRLDFFDRVEQRLGEDFTVHYSPMEMGALTTPFSDRRWARQLSPIRSLLPGLEWQPGVLSTPLRKGDIVVISGGPRTISSMVMLVWARMRGARTIWWGHYWSSTSKAHSFFLRRQLMRFASALLFYTDQEVEEYKGTYGKRDRRIVTALNNGINIDPIAALRMPYDAAGREKAIMFISRLVAKAELPILLNALADPRLHDVRLHIIGDGEERRALEAQSKNLGVGDRIVWHGGMTDEKTIAQVANTCRLFVYPGCVGLSLIHAMAYALPAIVHNNRYRQGPEIAAFTHGASGLSFIDGNMESLADAIACAINSKDDLNRWSANNVHQADRVYNTLSMTDRLCHLLSEMQLRLDNGDR